ncbi:hypothetical protein N431DRAFT_139165 [Stipitochalara longipes BDJ]|nr:hypothetical protein N431DRAFT_139165 [Stipitochalara longipes BDJ]
MRGRLDTLTPAVRILRVAFGCTGLARSRSLLEHWPILHEENLAKASASGLRRCGFSTHHARDMWLAGKFERAYHQREYHHVGSHKPWQLFAISWISSAESFSVSVEDMAGWLEQVQIIRVSAEHCAQHLRSNLWNNYADRAATQLCSLLVRPLKVMLLSGLDFPGLVT